MNISRFVAASATISRSQAGCCAASPPSPIGKARIISPIDLFLRWKDAFGAANNNTWSTRLGMVRGFAGWVQAYDARTEVPPPGLIAGRPRRTRPHIYSDAEVSMIVARAARLPSRYGLRGWTCSTLFGLIAVTGLRINEAVGLDDDDVDFGEGVITIRRGKNGKARFVPVAPSSVSKASSVPG